MFEVTFPRQGAVLNHRHGCEKGNTMEIVLRGVCDVAGRISVNGRPAERHGMDFAAPVVLDAAFNTIAVRLDDDFGTLTRELKVVWDRASFKRYDFFIDDNSFFLTDITRERPRSLFDHFYLKFLRDMHQKYGTCFSLNLFYRNDHDNSFDLSQVPDSYKGEWADNADWLRLAFHAYSEFPDRPYQNTPPEQIARDYKLVTDEIVRFAGAQSCIAMEALHWAIARPSSFKSLHDCGVRLLEGQFLSPRTGIFDDGEQEDICDVGYFRNLNDARFLVENRMLYDFRYGICFWKNDCTCNLLSVDQIRKSIEAVDRDTLGLATHEQYSFPRYFNYLPDHFERIEASIRCASERGYKPVFFVDGIFGNESWGKSVF